MGLGLHTSSSNVGASSWLSCANVDMSGHPSPAHLSRLTNLLSTIQIDSDKPLHSLLTSPLGAPTPLHISLSRTLPILTHQRSSFLEQLGAKIREAGVQPFTVLLSGGLRWASNEDGSRLFLVVQPSKGILEMGTLLRTCNRVVKDAGLGDRGLYEDSEQEFHFSIAWRLGNGVARSAEDGNESRKKTNINVDDGTLRKAWEASAGKEVSEIEVLFHKVMVRIGNAVHAVELAGKKPESSKKRGMVV